MSSIRDKLNKISKVEKLFPEIYETDSSSCARSQLANLTDYCQLANLTDYCQLANLTDYSKGVYFLKDFCNALRDNNCIVDKKCF